MWENKPLIINQQSKLPFTGQTATHPMQTYRKGHSVRGRKNPSTESGSNTIRVSTTSRTCAGAVQPRAAGPEGPLPKAQGLCRGAIHSGKWENTPQTITFGRVLARSMFLVCSEVFCLHRPAERATPGTGGDEIVPPSSLPSSPSPSSQTASSSPSPSSPSHTASPSARPHLHPRSRYPQAGQSPVQTRLK